MKKFKFFLILMLAGTLAACSSDAPEPTEDTPGDIPEAVTKAFETRFGKVENVKWHKSEDRYLAHFMENDLEREALYSTDGKLMMAETQIAVSDVPENIRGYITEQYAGYEMTEAEKTEEGDQLGYEVEIQGEGKELDLMFDGQGNFKGVEQEDDDEDDDDGEEEGEDDEDGEGEDGDVSERRMDPATLPDLVKQGIEAKYPGAELKDADEVTHNETGRVTYDVEIVTGDQMMEVMFDEQGTFLGVENDENDHEDGGHED